MKRRKSAAAELLWPLVFSVALVLLSWGVAEALAGGDLLAAARDLGVSRPAAERVHTRYDADLGWVNLPGISIPDMYGPGLSLTTNARGFRGADVSEAVPAGKRRVICSGDSFTLGYGVGDGATWPARLETLDAGLETVNMGQGGYGVDQSYLWYLRDGEKLAHDAHVHAFIFTDLERMRSADFLGYRKPVVSAGPSGIAAEKAPPPSGDYRMPWLTQKLVVLHRLRTVRALEALCRRYFLSVDDAPTRALAVRLFEDLDARAKARGARFAAVYLPTEMDLEPTRLDGLRAYLRAELARRGVVFIDLTPDFRALPSERLEKLYLTGEDSPFVGADGHYSEAGNALVARLLLEKLRDADVLPADGVQIRKIKKI